MKNYTIGIDIGTTSTKAVLFSESGIERCQCTVEYPLDTNEPKTAVQNPEEIFKAVVTSIRSIMTESGIEPKQVTVLSFSSAMHSLIAVDEKGQPLTPSITWADQRSEPYAKRLKEANGHALYEKTGTPIHAMSPLTKLIWLREEHPLLFKTAHKFIGIKEFVFYRLFKRFVIDHSVASATGLFNMYEKKWDQDALKTAGIAEDKLSELVPTTELFTEMDEFYAREMRLAQNTSVVIGANDGCLANLGVNALDQDVIALTIGTSGAIRMVTDRPVSDAKGRLFCYALTENHWVVGGAVNSGGMILRWLRDELCQEEVQEALERGLNPYDVITEKINQIQAGSKGLLFHPYLSGERAPSWNANARGSFYGLAMHHKREHMMRAVLEGINMNLYTVLQALTELIGKPEKIHATGGFVKSKVWVQMLADIFGQDVHISQTVESACLGAAVLGRYAVGEIDDISEVKRMVHTKEIIQPNPENVVIYKELMPIYTRLSQLFEEEYAKLVTFQEQYK